MTKRIDISLFKLLTLPDDEWRVYLNNARQAAEETDEGDKESHGEIHPSPTLVEPRG